MTDLQQLLPLQAPDHTFLFRNANFEKALFYFEKNHFEIQSKFYFEKNEFQASYIVLKTIDFMKEFAQHPLPTAKKSPAAFGADLAPAHGAFGTTSLQPTRAYPFFKVFFQSIFFKVDLL